MCIEDNACFRYGVGHTPVEPYYALDYMFSVWKKISNCGSFGYSTLPVLYVAA